MNSDANYPPVNYQSDGYGFIKPFKLKNGKREMLIDKGASSFKFGISNPKGEFKHLSSNITELNVYHRALFPLTKEDEHFLSYIDSLPYKIKESYFARGYILLDEIDSPCVIYECKMNGVNYLIVDSEHSMQLDVFTQILKSITYNFALISGNLIRNERYILQSNDEHFDFISGIKYNWLPDSIIGYKVIDPILFRQVYNTDKREFLSKEIFQTLVKMSISEPTQLRAISTLIESARYPAQIRASTYSVSLETIKNLIIDDKEKDINPIKKKADAKKIREKLKLVLDSFDDVSMFNNKNVLYAKIDNINAITNSASFLLSFKQLGITLTEEDIRCINYRNEFLHGRLSFDPANAEDEYQMNRVVFKLHLLICSLILKRAGFKGFLLNYFTYISLVNFKRENAEPLFRFFN